MRFSVKLAAPLALLLVQALSACAPRADVPPGYPRDYAQTIDAAQEEGALTLYGTIGISRVEALVAAFERKYPAIDVDYLDMPADEAFNRTIAEGRAGKGGGDIVWSSAMDLQIKLVNDGYAQAYKSPESGALPPGLVWKNEAFGITAERVVFAYNSRLLPRAEVPRTHAELRRFLVERPDMAGRVATYDPERSAVGFMFLREDLQASANTWQLVNALGRSHAKLFKSSDEILEALSSGEVLIAYNVISSYAQKRQQQDDIIGHVVPQDYTLLMSRIALITRDARHPNAARLFLDFMLSKEGQTILAQQSVFPVRSDVALPQTIREKTGQRRMIRVGPALLTHLDQLTRERFFRQWKEAYSAGESQSRGVGAQGRYSGDE
ncbi:MAG: ABC transporter substrate-binding protein [Sphingomonadales bacterium]|nr:ABC transporter substrate-binding protein [Sphingomonadales bacterium]